MKPAYLFFTAVLMFTLTPEWCSASLSIPGGLKVEKVVRPGEKVSGAIVLKNSGDKPCEIRIRKTDYLFYADGRNLYGEPGIAPRSNAAWLSVSPNRLIIPPRETMSVQYTIRVPDEPGLKGSYWSMLMVEPVPENSPERAGASPSRRQVGIQTVLRYGIQVVTDIGDTGERKIRFMNKKVAIERRRKTLQLDIENTGERWLAPAVWVELYDAAGAQIGRFDGTRLRIYPKCSVKHSVDLANVRKGSYRALVIADNGDDYVFGARYDLEIP